MEELAIKYQADNKDLLNLLDKAESSNDYLLKQVNSFSAEKKESLRKFNTEKSLWNTEKTGLKREIKKQKRLKVVFLVGPPLLYGAYKVETKHHLLKKLLLHVWK